MINVTELATGRINNADAVTVERVEADENPAVAIIRWPAKPTVVHHFRFPVRRRRGDTSLRRCRRELAQVAASRPSRATVISIDRGGALMVVGWTLPIN